MLSISMLAPVYSIFMNIDITWVYKIVFPLLFSLLPVALFEVYRRHPGKTSRFFPCLCSCPS